MASAPACSCRIRTYNLLAKKTTGWRKVKPCDVGIDAHRSAASQGVALRQPAHVDGASRRSSPSRVGTPMDRGRLRTLQGKGCPPPLEFSGAATNCPYPRTEDLGTVAPICGVSTIDFQRGRSNQKIGKRQAAALQTDYARTRCVGARRRQVY